MCPDEQLLSAYADGELPETARQTIERHLEKCDACSDRVRDFLDLGDSLRHADIRIDEDIRGRVYRTIMARRRLENLRPPYRRTVRLPVPVAAAAALIVILSLGLFFFRDSGRSGGAVTAVSEIVIPPEEASIHTLEEAVRVFESQNAHIEIYIQLPSETSFSGMGEPVFIREADFKPRAR